MMSKRYFSHKEAASYLGVSQSVLYQWVRRKLIAVKKHGSLNFYDVEALDNFGKKSVMIYENQTDLDDVTKAGIPSSSMKPATLASSLTSKQTSLKGHPTNRSRDGL